MAHKNKPDRWQSLALSAALAVAGTLVVLDKLPCVIRPSAFLSHTVPHLAPIFLLVVAVSWVLADDLAAALNVDRDPEEDNRE